MEITSEKAGDSLVVRVFGELDLDTARDFRTRVDADLDRYRCRNVVLDFGGVAFVDSSGLGAILGRYKRAREKGGQVALCRPLPHVGRLLDLAGVVRIVRTYRGVEEALAALGWKEKAQGGDTR